MKKRVWEMQKDSTGDSYIYLQFGVAIWFDRLEEKKDCYYLFKDRELVANLL